MKKIVLLGFFMAFSLEAISALPPTNVENISPKMSHVTDSVKDVPLAFRVLL